jgi:dephospho-CoA kinase
MRPTKVYRTLAVGVTGGIGSGKSEVCHIFESLGARVIDADLNARALVDHDPDIQQRIKRSFGQDVYRTDGTLDRNRMAMIVFNDENARRTLEAIVHPRVLQAIAQDIDREKHDRRFPIVCVEAALLFEAAAEKMFDYMIVVDANETIRFKRLQNRDGGSEESILARMSAQLPVQEKKAKADFVIQNDDDVDSLRTRCEFVFRLLITLSKTSAS